MKRPEIYETHDIPLVEEGYYRHPALWKDQLIFVSEDDLWSVKLSGGVARRLTGSAGQETAPAISPCGEYLAYTSTEQGCPEVFVMAARGGSAQKLTFSGAKRVEVIGWSVDGQKVLFRSNLREPFARQTAIYEVPRVGGAVQRLDLGQAHRLGFSPDGKGRVLARYRDDLARWKGYRGGAAGQLWIDEKGKGKWRRLLPELSAGLCRPMWIGERIYFISDVDGCANIYSTTIAGEDRRRHTNSEDHYVRFASHFEKTIVYACGGALYQLQTDDDQLQKIPIDYASPKVQLKEKFTDAREYLDDYDLHPSGHSLSITARGKAFNFGNWEGAVRQIGSMQGVRYRLTRYLNDGEHVLLVSDEGGEEHFEVHRVDGKEPPRVLDTREVDPGRAVDLSISPTDEAALFTNHRHELFHLCLETGKCTFMDSSPYDRIAGIDWSPDGRWIAYGYHEDFSRSRIKIIDLDSGECHNVTSGDFQDVEPVFDPAGRYLYFLSYRHFDPVYDQLFFELSFPRGMKPCVITLRETLSSPFEQVPHPLDGDTDDLDDDDDDEDSSSGAMEIDFDNIADRLEVFPVEEGSYGEIAATATRVFWTVFPVAGSIDEDPDEATGLLQYYDLKKKSTDVFANDTLTFILDGQRKTIALWDSDDLWVLSASGDGLEDELELPGRSSGLVDLDRVSLAVDPRSEWCQMLREAWRLMRDHFWREDMGGVDWEQVWERYKGLLARVSTRTEFSDLVWTMQGELGTSHAFEQGGDYRRTPQYQPGFLGAEFEWEEDSEGYRITRILRGDPWDAKQSSPLVRSGCRVEVGDILLAINGQRLSERVAPGHLLANQSRRQVELLVTTGDGQIRARSTTVLTLSQETSLRYREWVELNRRTVHEASEGRIGYIHIPDMEALGYGEFHRQFLSENRRQALIIDVRDNSGGHVSQLILEKLARKPMAFEMQRWGKATTYPQEAVAGPLVALTNEAAGSDGDIFSHSFKLMNLGPLIGKRTWGGVVGVHPRHELVDGSMTTQPEFSIWFKDVGFGLENWGTEPDIDVEYPPQSSPGAGDPQLQAAIEKMLELLSTSEVLEPPER